MAAANFAPHSSAPRAAAYTAPLPAHTAPPGTFASGTKVQVGSHRVTIIKYLSEGGFAHVYVVQVPGRSETSVLKRVAVPDKDALASMRTEVETMKKLKGHKHIVTYIDSHASQLKGGGYEVFLLMEFCAGGGLIDFMNTRLQVRLTEPEILKIFGDVSEGVATMHYLKPPLLHRDLKVENILISKPPSSSSGVLYKLCDFGSTAPPRPAATNASEARLIEDDVQRHTTLQYRSPEMIDVWRKQPIDEKSDIWALGVLLYKLCYYTTPFEEVGQMAILNASFKYPHHPPFSERLKRLIGSMLKEDPKKRPSIYQVVHEVCSMRGTTVPIKDIYAGRTQSEARSTQRLPPTSPQVSSPPAAGISVAAPIQHTEALPEIAPMRRGRPSATTANTPSKPSSSPAKGDPFAALDSKSHQVRAGAVDELSAKYPSLDEFSITLNKDLPFKAGGATGRQGPQADLGTRVTNALADQAFAQTRQAASDPSKSDPPSAFQSRATSLKQGDKFESRGQPPKQSSAARETAPIRPGYTSTGTMTSDSPPPSITVPPIKRAPIWRVPSHGRSSSQPRPSDEAKAEANSLKASLHPGQGPALTDIHRSKSQTALAVMPTTAVSSRPSLEGRRPSDMDTHEPLSRAKSASYKSRPPSGTHVDSNLEFLRERESSSKNRPSLELRRSYRDSEDETAIDEAAIENDTDYLKNMEDNDSNRRSSRKTSQGHSKRVSMPAMSLSGTKNMIAGKFGDALKRFERSAEEDQKPPPPLQPLQTPGSQQSEHQTGLLSPISGSKATTSPPRQISEVNNDLEELEDVPPEVRRELERRRLSQEEHRVAAAAAEYKTRAAGGFPAPSRASTIQKRVQALLDEGRQSPVHKKTAAGYGRYTDIPPEDFPTKQASAPQTFEAPIRQIVRKAPVPTPVSQPLYQGVQPSASAPPAQTRVAPRPSAPPKPKAFRTGTPVQAAVRGPPAVVTQRPSATSTDLPASGGSSQSRLAALIAQDQVGVATAGSGSPYQDIEAPVSTSGLDENGDWEADFSKRYPSLSGIEMVETEISTNGGSGGVRRGMRVRDV